MPENPGKLGQFWQELKRRKVVRVITVYAAVSFVILELVSIIVDPLKLPDWTLSMVIVLLVIGFLLTVVLSWIYDVTPEGIQRTRPVKPTESILNSPSSRAWKISTYISILIIISFVGIYIVSNLKKSNEISKLEKSIAVLPFENWSYAEEFSHLGNAISNEIITELYKINEFRVLSYTSTRQYKQGTKSIPVIGQELGVNYIIEGVVERQDDMVNIHVQVIRAKNEDHIWANEFYGKWEDVFRIQDEIALEVARELKAVLTENEVEQIEENPTDNPEAYNYYLRGLNYYWQTDEEQDWNIAIKMFQKAIELDPNFALAYTRLSKCHIEMYWYHYDRTDERRQESKKAIDVALRINSDLVEAQIALGIYYYAGFLDYQNALKQYNAALKLQPDNAESIYYIAAVYRRMGKWPEAEEAFERAAGLDPGNQLMAFNAAETYFLTGKYDLALQHINRAISLKPEFNRTYRQKIDILLKKDGDTREARSVLDKASMIISPSSHHLIIEIKILLDMIEGNYQEALNFLNTTSFEASQPQFYYYPKQLFYAMIYDLMEDHEKADYYYDLSRNLLEAKIIEHPVDSRFYSTLGISLAGMGQKEKAISAGIKATEIMPYDKEAYRGTYRLVDLARIYCMVGEYDLAEEQLDTLLSRPGILSAKLLKIDPIWKPLWDQPGFKQLLIKYQ